MPVSANEDSNPAARLEGRYHCPTANSAGSKHRLEHPRPRHFRRSCSVGLCRGMFRARQYAANVARPLNYDLAVRMADLARTLAHERTLDAVLAEVTSAAVELIPGVDTAGILLVKGRSSFESLATPPSCPISSTFCR